MPDTLESHPESLTFREELETIFRPGAADAMEALARLLSLTNSRAVVEGLTIAAGLAHVVTEQAQGAVARVSPDDLRRMGAAFAALIRDESARFDWKAHPSQGGFLQQMYGRHPEAQEALVTGATLNARALKDHAPPSPAVTPTVPPSDPATVSLPLARPCSTCRKTPRRPKQRTCSRCHADAMRESRRRTRARERAVALPHTTSQWPPNPSHDQAACEWCEQTFTPLHWGQRFCGNICGGKAATAVLEAEQQRRAEGQQSMAHGPAWNRGNSKPSVPLRARVPAQSHWDPRLVERLKNIVVDVPKHPGGKPETIRVSALPMGHHLYADVRVYLRGHPTRQGLVVHTDLIADVITGLQEVVRRGWKP
jgi:hypothetical protein